jgi:hypothetical protein
LFDINMLSFAMRSEASWPSDFKRLIGLCGGVAGALAISFTRPHDHHQISSAGVSTVAVA